jgi:hypothetical protein
MRNLVLHYASSSGIHPLIKCDCTLPQFLLEDYLLIVERRFARRGVPESYAGGSVSFW